MIGKILSFFNSQQEKSEVKPKLPLKRVTEFPAKILVIDYDNFDSYTSKFGYKSRIHRKFKQEIDSNIYEFYFARDFQEASVQILINPPDLILCEIVLPLAPCQPEFTKMESKLEKIGKSDNNGSLNFNFRDLHKLEKIGSEELALEMKNGFKIFDILKSLNLNFTIPVIFWGNNANFLNNRSIGLKLGAFDCIDLDYKDNKINQAVRKALDLNLNDDLIRSEDHENTARFY